MRRMGLEAIYPKPRLSANRNHGQDLPVLAAERGRPAGVDQVWSADITYLPMASGFMYLAATIDWFSRYVLSWRLSNTLDGSFCQEMLEEALSRGETGSVQHRSRSAVHGGGVDGGSVGTSVAWSVQHGRTGSLSGQRVRGAAVAHQLKYEDVYLRGYEKKAAELERGLWAYFRFLQQRAPFVHAVFAIQDARGGVSAGPLTR